MSQNFFQAGDLVSLIGWDRPTQSAFLILGEMTNTGDDWAEPLILDLDYPFDRIHCLQHAGEVVIAMKARLELAGVCLPESAFDHLASDIENDVGNVRRVHYLDKEPVVFSEEPFSSGLFKKR